MSGRINKGNTVFKAKVGGRKSAPPRKKQTQPPAESAPLPTPPATQETQQTQDPSQSDLNENNKRAAPEPSPAQTPAEKRQAPNTGLATPTPTQQSQKAAPIAIMPSRTPTGLSFNQRLSQQKQQEQAQKQAQRQGSQQPLTTRASQQPLQTRATATPLPTPGAAPLNTRASQNPLQTRASQATSGTPAPAAQAESSLSGRDKENGDGDDEDDDQLELSQDKAENKRLSARQLRTQKMRFKKRPIEEIWREDPEAQPIDPSNYKMSDLINDPGVGRLSSRVIDVTRKHAQMKQRRREEKARLRELTEEELKLDAGDDGTGRRRTVEDEEKQKKEREEAARKKKEEKKAEKKRVKEQKRAEQGEEVVDEDGVVNEKNDDSSSDDDDDDEANEQQGPQMRLVNGRMVVDEQSLMVDRSAHAHNDTSAYEVTDELDSERFVNTNTWRGKGRGRQDRWTRLETEMFYDALSRFGTDFEMIAMLFKGRTRRVIKAKFSREEKYNSDLITQALKNRKPFDLIQYGNFIGVDLSGPPPEIRVPTPMPQAEDGVQKKDEPEDGAEEIVDPDEEEHRGRGRRPSASSASVKRKQSRGPGGRDPGNEEGAEVVGIVEGGQVVAA